MADAWSGFAGAVIGGLLGALGGAWAASRYAYVQALRLAWADWTASALDVFLAMLIRDRVERKRKAPFDPFVDKSESDVIEKAKLRVLDHRSSFEREHLRLVLLEREDEWIEAADRVHARLGEHIDQAGFDQISGYLRDKLVPRNRARFRSIWLEGCAPRSRLDGGVSG